MTISNHSKLNNLKAALSYAAKGWPVFPVYQPEEIGQCSCKQPDCPSPAKHPIIKNGVLGATTNPEQIEKWWTDWPNANIAIRTGKISGLVVLDNDPDKGGNASLQDIEDQYGSLPRTVSVRTGGEGSHYYFITPSNGLKNSVSKIGLGLDVRGENGYVIAPPSRHVSGNYYEWFVSPEESSLAALPPWFHNLSLPKTAKIESRNQDAWITKALLSLNEGNRNDTFCKLIGRFHHDGWNIEDIITLLLPHAEGVDFPIDELTREVEYICKRYPNNSTSPLPIYSNGKVEKLTPLLLSTVPEPGPRVELVEGLIPEGHITLLYGNGGQGKSYTGLFLGTCISLGLPFADLKTKKVPTLYLDWELDESEHARRGYQIARGMGLSKPPDGLYYLKLSQSIHEVVDALKEIITQQNIGFVILDSLGPACGGDPESAKFVIPLLAKLRSLGITILILDHQSKAQKEQRYDDKTPFGSIYKFNLARSVIQAKRVDGRQGELSLTLTPTKSNLSFLADTLPIKLLFKEDVVELQRGDFADPTFLNQLNGEDKIINSLREDGPATVKTLSERTGVKSETVTNITGRLKKSGLIYVKAKDKHAPIYAIVDSDSSVLDDNKNGGSSK